MYAVIRAGGKQYRVAPGDVIRVEKLSPNKENQVEFSEILAVSGEAGKIGKPGTGARVLGSVVENGRADKILVFHFKRKKQYKKLQGHRQDFTAVRIEEIAFDGQSFKAPDAPARKPKKGVADKIAGAAGTVAGVVAGAADVAAAAVKPAAKSKKKSAAGKTAAKKKSK
jgi:large subunit ribosomal protein L21